MFGFTVTHSLCLLKRADIVKGSVNIMRNAIVIAKPRILSVIFCFPFVEFHCRCFLILSLRVYPNIFNFLYIDFACSRVSTM